MKLNKFLDVLRSILSNLFAKLCYATDEAGNLLVLQPLSSGTYLSTLLSL